MSMYLCVQCMYVFVCPLTWKKKMERLMQQSDITDTALVTAVVNVKPLH